MLRLQAKQQLSTILPSVEKSHSQVSPIAKHLPGTVLKSSFLRKRDSSWQAHLKRISPYIVGGEGVWWESIDSGFHFFDGDQDDSSRDEPRMLHFHQHSVSDVQDRQN